MAARRAHRVSVDAARGNARSPAPLDRVVQPEDQRSLGGKGAHQQLQQNPAGCQTRPYGAIEYPVVGLEVPLLAQAHDAQHGGHRAFAGSEDGPGEQHLHRLKHPLGKQAGEGYD